MDCKKEREVFTLPEAKQESYGGSNYFCIQLYKNYKIQILKPLIPLKVTLFLWYGCGTVITAYFTVFLKDKGFTLFELSLTITTTPVIQLVWSLILGIIVDKIGRVKPVLIANMLLCTAVLICIAISPNIDTRNCNNPELNLQCHNSETNELVAKAICNSSRNNFEINFCQVLCIKEKMTYCYEKDLNCDFFRNKSDFLSFFVAVNASASRQRNCFHDNVVINEGNEKIFSCLNEKNISCNASCPDCSSKQNSRMFTLMVNSILSASYLTIYSSCFRLFDVLVMSVLKKYGVSSFGKERFWSMFGALAMPSLAACLVQTSGSSTVKGKNVYAIYLTAAIHFVAMIMCLRLDASINDPGEKMWKKAITFLKSPEVLSFIIILIIVGTEWGFEITFKSLFLQQFDIPGYFLGVLFTLSSLYSLPFLLTSKWWMKKLRPTTIIVLALIARAVNFLAYSFLIVAWPALLFECTSIFTYHLLWVAVIRHCYAVAPEGLVATVLSTAGALHFNFGRGSGSLIGGLLIDSYGYRVAYLAMGVISIICAVLYGIYLIIRLSQEGHSKPKQER